MIAYVYIFSRSWFDTWKGLKGLYFKFAQKMDFVLNYIFQQKKMKVENRGHLCGFIEKQILDNSTKR